MIFKNIQTPQNDSRRRTFQPGRWLWVFTAVFLPLFVTLGVWQLNRGFEKEQMLAVQNESVLPLSDIDWQNPPLLRQSRLTGQVLPKPVLLLDNKTHNGQFGYEVFVLVDSVDGAIAVSLGWVSGSADRRQLPDLFLPKGFVDAAITLRLPPTNPLFGVEANAQTGADIWVSQSLTTDWLTELVGRPVLGFAQLNRAEELGVGPVVWQATTMSPAKHFSYSVQWFCMAAALLVMFLYAGFVRRDKKKSDE